MSEEQKLGRRNFMGLATFTIGGFMAAGFGIPAVIYLTGPALKEQAAQEWIRLGATSKVEVGTPTLFRIKVSRQTGWIISEEELSFYVLTENGRDFIAMSNICTHLGCRARWIEADQQFFCPCHNGIFDKTGAVIGGPPPRPLDRYEVKVEDDQLFILGG